MGRSRYKITEPSQVHFMTCTLINWTPIFTRPGTVQILLDSFSHLRKTKGFKLYGFVILENLQKQMSSFKSYTAKMIIRYLEQHRVNRLLEQLSLYKKAHKTDRQYQVWEEGVHPQLVQNETMLRQKLDYIHQNPVKRGYVEQAAHWRYSSASNYEYGHGVLDDVFIDWG